MTILVLLALPLDVRTVDVDLLEFNRVLYESGEVRFVQVVAWDDAGSYTINRGYRVGADPPTWCGTHWAATHWRGGRSFTVVRSRVLLYREGPDYEAAFRASGGAFRPCW